MINLVDRLRGLPTMLRGNGDEPDARLAPVQRVSTGTAAEDRIGSSRAVRVGDVVVVSGCSASLGDERPVSSDAHAQTSQAFEHALIALTRTGLRRSDVVRTRIYVVDLPRHVDAVARAHSSIFDAVRPTVSLVGVAALATPGVLVEVELDAVRRPAPPQD